MERLIGRKSLCYSGQLTNPNRHHLPTNLKGPCKLGDKNLILNIDERPTVLAIADKVRAQRLTRQAKDFELFSRYQAALDGQVYKALRALRDAQQLRQSSLEANTTEAWLDKLEATDGS